MVDEAIDRGDRSDVEVVPCVDHVPLKIQEDEAYQGRWVSANVRRIIGLTILGRFGLHTFDGLPVVAFAVSPGEPTVTATYSWRLQQNFGAHYDYIADIRAASKSMQVLVGSTDELILPAQMQKLFHAQRPEVLVEVLPDLGHSEIVTDQEAIEAVVNACGRGSIG